jgi:hypothetical protein
MKLLATLVTLTLLAGSTNALAATDPLRLAPPSPQLPKGLPLAQRIPGGVMLPDSSAHALHTYIIEWELYPGQAQTAMDELYKVMTVQAAEQRNVDAAKAAQVTDARVAEADRHRLTLPRVGFIAGVAAAITFGLTEYFEHKGKR